MLGPPQDANLVRGLQRIGQALLQVGLPSDALHAQGGPLGVLKLTRSSHCAEAKQDAGAWWHQSAQPGVALRQL